MLLPWPRLALSPWHARTSIRSVRLIGSDRLIENMLPATVGIASRKDSTGTYLKGVMVSTTIAAPAIVIRDIERLSEMREVETLQKDVWGCDDLDVVPLTMLVATREVGAVLVGAYDGASLVGFVYGFPGYENGRLVHHSHMLAVKSAYRN